MFRPKMTVAEALQQQGVYGARRSIHGENFMLKYSSVQLKAALAQAGVKDVLIGCHRSQLLLLEQHLDHAHLHTL